MVTFQENKRPNIFTIQTVVIGIWIIDAFVLKFPFNLHDACIKPRRQQQQQNDKFSCVSIKLSNRKVTLLTLGTTQQPLMRSVVGDKDIFGTADFNIY